MATETKNKPTHIINVGPARLSWMHVFKPRKKEGKAPQYEVTLLFPKAPTKQNGDPGSSITLLKDKMVDVAKAKFGDIKGVRMALRDGDAVSEENPEPRHPGYWYANATAKDEYPPTLVDGSRQKAVPGAWVSGDWGLANVAVYAYTFEGKKGVSLGLRALQFLYKDEPFGSSASIEDTFDVVPGSDRPTATNVTGAADDYDPFADQ